MSRGTRAVLVVSLVLVGAFSVGQVLAATVREAGGSGSAPCTGLTGAYKAACDKAITICDTLKSGIKSYCIAKVEVAFGEVPGAVGPAKKASTTTTTPTSSGDLRSPNGAYSVTVSNSGITLGSPSVTIEMHAGVVTIKGPAIRLNGCGHGLSHAGDLAQLAHDPVTGASEGGTITTGSAVVCVA